MQNHWNIIYVSMLRLRTKLLHSLTKVLCFSCTKPFLTNGRNPKILKYFFLPLYILQKCCKWMQSFLRECKSCDQMQKHCNIIYLKTFASKTSFLLLKLQANATFFREVQNSNKLTKFLRKTILLRKNAMFPEKS